MSTAIERGAVLLMEQMGMHSLAAEQRAVENKQLAAGGQEVIKKRDELKAENDSLKKEIKVAATAIKDFLNGERTPEQEKAFFELLPRIESDLSRAIAVNDRPDAKIQPEGKK